MLPVAVLGLLVAVHPAPSVEVRIDRFTYEPNTVRVARGTRVRWVNRDISNHTVTFRRGPGDLGNIHRGGVVSARFKRPGRYGYVCIYHPGMRGTVVVRRHR